MAAATTIVAGAAIAGTAVSAYSANQQGKAASKAQASADAANQSAEMIAMRQQQIAEEQWNNYKTMYLPLEQEAIQGAKNYGSIANQEKAATNAAAATQASFAGAKDQLNKTPGLNPNSQQYLREVARLGISEAATSAAAQTGARKGVADTGAALIKDAAALGKGVSSNAAAALSGAAATTGAVAGNAQSYANSAYNRAQGSAAGVGQMVGGLSQSGAFKTIGNAVGGLYDKYSGGGWGTGNTFGNQDQGQYL